MGRVLLAVWNLLIVTLVSRVVVRSFQLLVTGVFSYTRVRAQRRGRARVGLTVAAVAGLALLALGYGMVFKTAQATATPANTINFQARLEQANGAIAPDGNYNVEFKLYSVACSTSPCSGTALWTEDYLNSASNGIRVVNGYLTANLGSISSFPSGINWGQQLYLTMNIGGTASSASWDGEMLPRLSLTSVPSAFALNSYNSTLGYTSSLTLAQPTGGNQTFSVPDQGAAGSYTLLTTNTANTSFIQNQNASAQATSNFWISGTGKAATSLQAPLIDAATAGTLSIGTTTATAITIGGTGIPTTVAGTLTTTGLATANGGLTVTTGSTFTNASSTVLTPKVLSLSATGDIGTKATTVDVASAFNITATATGKDFTLPTPTASTTAGRVVYVSNVGTNSFTMYGTTLAAGTTESFVYNGSAWTVSGAGSSGNYIQNGTSVQAGANFNIGGNGTIGGTLAVTGAATFSSTINSDTLTSTSLQFSGVNPTISPSTTNTGLNVDANGTGTLTLDTTGAGTVTVGTSAATLNIGGGSSAEAVNIGNSTGVDTIHIGTDATAADTIVQGNSNAGTTAKVQGGANYIFVSNSGLGVGTTAPGAMLDVNGTFNASGLGTFNAGLTVTSSVTPFSNAASTLLPVITIANKPTGGSIGTAASTVDITSALSFNQTSAGQTVIVPNPTVTTAGRVLYLTNVGSARVVIDNSGGTLGIALSGGYSAVIFWNGTEWTTAGVDSGGGNYIQNQTTLQAGASFNIGGSGQIAGTLTVGGAATFNGGVTVAAGTELQVAGSTVFNSMSISNHTSSGAIGTAAATVDGHTTFSITQTTAGITLSLPTPTDTTASHIVYVISLAGNATFTMGSVQIAAGQTASFLWNGSAWVIAGTTGNGANSIGTFDTYTAAANGATISGTTLYLQSASTSVPGLVNTGTQSFAGTKTFTGQISATLASGTGLAVTANATIGGTLGVTGATTIGGALTVSAGGASISGGLNNNNGGITNAGAISGATGITSSGTITFSGLSTAGIVTNTAAGQLGTVSSVPVANGGTGLTSVTAGQILVGTTAGGLTATTIASGTNISVTSTSGSVSVATISNPTFSGLVSATLASGTGLAVTANETVGGTLVVSGTINTDTLNSTSLTFSGATADTITSAAGATLGLNTGTAGGTITTNAGTLKSTQGGTTTIDLSSASATYLDLDNSGSGAANLELASGDLYTGGTAAANDRLTNAGVLKNITGITSSGTITFSGLSSAGIVTNTAAGVLGTESNVTVAQGGTGITSYTAGQILVGNSSGGLTATTIASGTNINVTSTSGSVSVATVNNPVFSGEVQATLASGTGLAVTANATIGGTLGVTGATTLGGALTVSAGGASITGGINNHTGGITNAGAISGATGVTSSGTITFSGLSSAGIVTNTAAGVLGTVSSVPTANGGTGASSFTANGILYGNGSGNILATAASTAAGQCLIESTSSAPAWGSCTTGAVTTIGTLDSEATPSADGATISASTLILQSASTSVPGLVNTSAQSFAGTKTFTGQISATLASGTGLAVTANATIGGTLVVSGTINTDTLSSTVLTFSGANPTISPSTTNTGLNVKANGTGTLALDTTGAGTITIGSSAATVTIGGGTSAETLNLGNSSGVDTINLGTGGGADVIKIGGSGGSIALQTNTTISGTTTLSSLNTAGIVTNTAAGVLGTVASVPVANGGTGLSSVTAGQILVGNSSGGLTATTIASGTNINVTNASGSVSVTTVANPTFSTSVTTPNLYGSAGGALTVQSAAGQGLALNTGTAGGTITTNAGTIQRTATGTTNIDLKDSGTTTLQLENSGSGVANLNLYGGSLETGSTPTVRLTNAGALTNITGITSSGTITFSGLNTAGIVTNTSAGVLGTEANITTAQGGTGITSYTAGQILVGNSSGGLTATTIASGTNINVTSTSGSVSVATVNNPVFSGEVQATLASGTGLAVTANATIGGTLTVGDAATFNGDLTVSSGNALTIGGSTIFGTLAIANHTSNGAIGTAAATVDSYSAFKITQTTTGITLSIPNPTVTTGNRIIYINSVAGNASFTIGGVLVSAGQTAQFIWNGSSWIISMTTGVGTNTIGTLDTYTNAANGATISGSVLYMQSASASVPGLVNTGTQSFAGTKTFTGQISATLASGTGLAVTANATIGGTLGVTGATTLGGALTVSAGGATFNGGINNTGDGITNAGAISGATGITSSGTITFSGLSTAGIVTNTAAGQLGTVSSVPVANGGTGLSSVTAGQILVGNSSGGLTATTIASGTNISVTSTSGSVSVATINNPTFSGLVSATLASGTGLAVTANETVGGTLVVSGTINTDTLNSTALTFSGANPTISPSTTNTGLNLKANGTGTLALDTTGAGAITIGSSAASVTIGGGTAAETLNLGNSSGVDTINLGTGGGADVIKVGGSGGSIALQTNTTISGTTTLSALSTAGIVTNTAAGVLGTVSSVPTANGGTGISSYSAGQILVGNSSGSLTATTIGSGTNINVTNASGSILVATVNNPTFSGLVSATLASGTGLAVTANETVGGTLVVSGTINTDTLSATGLTFSGATADTITSASGATLGLNTGTAGGTITTNAGTIKSTASGTTTIDLSNAATTTLQLENSGSGVANLNLYGGALETGTTPTVRLTNAGVLQNVTYQGNTVGVAYGGTGATTFTANELLLGNGTGALSQVSGVGTSGQCLIASGAAPSWGSCTTGAITTIGTLDSEGTPSANGATISGSTLILQSASTSVAGLVNTGAQSFAGTKTFTGQISDTLASGTGLAVTANATIGGTLGVTGATTLGAALTVSAGGVTFNGGINNTGDGITNAGTISGATGITSSGTVTFSGLNTAGIVTNTAAGVLGTVAHVTVAQGGTGLGTVTSGQILVGNSSGGLTATTIGSGTNINVTNGSGSVSVATVNNPTFSGLVSATLASGTGLAVTANETVGGTLAVTGTINADTLSSTGLTFSGATADTITSAAGATLGLNTGTAGGTLTTNAATIQRTASGTTNIDLSNAGTTLLQLENSGSGVADLNLYGGALETGSTPTVRLTNAGALTNITAITSSGAITFSGLSTAGIVTNTAAGVLGTEAHVTVAQGGTGLGAVSSGQLLIGNSSGGLTAAALTQGTNAVITSTSGSVTVGVATNPTFTGLVTASATGTGLAVTHNATIGGTLAVTGDTTLSTVTATGLAEFSGGLTVDAGTTLEVGGSTIFDTMAIANHTGNSTIGTAAATVDGHSSFTITQTTANVTLTLPNPTNTTSSHVVYVYSASGNVNFTMYGVVISATNTATFIWNGSSWTIASTTGNGANSIGALDTFTNATNGATISGATLYLQSASTSVPGLVNTGTQSFVGAKTFTSATTFGAALTVSAGGASINGGLNNTGDGITNTGAISGATAITSSGTITFSGLNTAGIVTNTAGGVLGTESSVPVAQGGTGTNSFTTNGVLFGNSTGAIQATAAGASGQCLVANGSGVPVWSTCSGSGSGNTLQTDYNNSTGGTTPEIVENSTGTGLDIQAYNGQSADLLDLRAYAASGLGTLKFGVTVGGAVTEAGALTVSAGGANITGGISNNNGGITGTGSLAGVTGIATSGSYTQTGTGANTFSGDSSFTGSGTGLAVTNAATIGTTLTVTGATTLNGGVAVNLAAGKQLAVAPSANPTTDLVTIGNTTSHYPTSSTDAINAEQLTWYAKPNTGLTSSAERINVTNSNTAAGGQVQGMRIVATGAGGSINSDTDGIYIDGLTNASSGTNNENALEIGSGWDNVLLVNGTPVINGSGQINLAQTYGTLANANLTNSGALTVTAGNGLTGGGSVALGGTTTLTVGAGSCITVGATTVGVTDNCVNAATVGGVSASGFIQNGTSPQTADFNITGNGTVGGTLAVGGALIVGANSTQGDFVEYSDTFDGSTVNTANWNVTGAATQNNNLSVTGAGAWTNRGVTTTQAYRRSNTLTFTTDVTTPAAAANFMVGLASSPTVMNYTNIVHAIYFNSGNLVIYENGTSRGTHGTYSVSTTYKVRIAVNNTGATYYISSDGGNTWTLLYDGTANNVTTSPLYPRLDVDTAQTVTIDNLTVSNGRDVLTNGYFVDGNLTVGEGNLNVNGAITGTSVTTPLVTSTTTTLTLNTSSAGGTISTNASTLTSTNSGTTNINLNNAGTTTLQLENSGSGVANLNLYGGSLETGSSATVRLDNAGNLQNIGTYSGSGNIVTSGGVLQVQGTGASYIKGNLGVGGVTSPVTALDVNGSISSRQNNVRTYQDVYSSYTASASTTGTLEIILPNTWNNTMIRFQISGYDYSTSAAWQAIVSGYNYATTPAWTNTSAEIRGNPAPFTSIRLAYDSSLSKNVLLLGTTSSIWHYPGFSIDEVVASYTNQDTWGGTYSSAFLTSEANITNINSPATQQIAYQGTTFIQGGNSFGATAVLGTNDNNSLQIRTNGTTRLTIDTSGNGTLTGNLTVSGTGASSIAGSLSVTTSVTTPVLNATSAGGIITTNAGTIKSTASGTTNIDLSNAATTTLQLENSSSGVANLNLYGGSLETGSTPTVRLTNAGALSNITGYSQTSGVATFAQNATDSLQVTTNTGQTPTSDMVAIGNLSTTAPTATGVDAEQLTWYAKPSGTNTSSAEKITLDNVNTAAGGQVQGLHIAANGAGGSIASDTVGILIDALASPSSGTANENAIEIDGATWDNALYVDGHSVVNGTGILQSAAVSGSYTGITGVGTLTTGTWNATAIAANYGGTGQSSYTIGDMLYASSSTALSKLTDVGTGSVLLSGGVGSPPTWGKVALTTAVSGVLPVANGGTGTGTTPTSGQILIGNSSSGYTVAALTQGSNISITNGSGSITVATVQNPTFSTSVTSPSYIVTAVAGNGIGFWGGAPSTYGIFMSNAAGGLYGPVTDYYLAENMSSGTGRGFVWEYGGTASAALNASTGNFATKGTITINGTGASTIAGATTVGGGTNTTQLIVKANASQSKTTPLAMLQDSTGGELARISADSLSNMFFGSSSGSALTTGSGNTGMGGLSLSSITTGYQNTAQGNGALESTSTGTSNTAQGSQSLVANSSGSGNTAVGYSSLQTNTVGSNNTAVGYFSDVCSNNLQNASAIGAYSCVSQSNSLVLGCTSGVNSCTTSTKVGIGTSAPSYTFDVQGGDINTSGYLREGGNIALIATYSTHYATFVGVNAGNGTASTGISNTATGVNSLLSLTSGSYNTASGVEALQNTTTGSGNSAFGVGALQFNSTGSYNSALGYSANVGANNLQNATAIGAYSSVNQSDSLVLGCVSGTNSCSTSTKVGVGTTAPVATFDVEGTTVSGYTSHGTDLNVTNNSITTGNIASINSNNTASNSTSNLLQLTYNPTVTTANTTLTNGLLNVARTVTDNVGTGGTATAPVYSGSVTGSGSGTTNVTVALCPCGGIVNRTEGYIIVWVAQSDTTVPTVSLNSSYGISFGNNKLSITNGRDLEAYGIPVPVSWGSNTTFTISVDWGAHSETTANVMAAMYLNVGTVGSPIGFSNAVASTSMSGTVSTGIANGLVADVLYAPNASNTGFTKGTGQSIDTAGPPQWLDHKSSTGSTTLSYSWSGSTTYADIAIPLGPAYYASGATTIGTLNGFDKTNTGAVATFTNSCSSPYVACNDYAPVLSLVQSDASASGSVVNIQNAGFGPAIQIGDSSTVNDQSIQINSANHAAIVLNGDTTNASGEPGGEYIQFTQDAQGVVGYVGVTQQTGYFPDGTAITAGVAGDQVAQNTLVLGMSNSTGVSFVAGGAYVGNVDSGGTWNLESVSSNNITLNVIGSSTGYVQTIKNTLNAANANGLQINMTNLACSSMTGATSFIDFYGSGGRAGSITGINNGKSCGSNNVDIAYNTSSADYAEYYPNDPSNLPQDHAIIAFAGGDSDATVAATDPSAPFVGAISDTPGFVGNAPFCPNAETTEQCDADTSAHNNLVSMLGQVPVLVNDSNGAIHVGDPIGLSSTAGVGAKMTGSGYIVGYAEESLTGDSGTIQVMIRPQFYTAPLQGDEAISGGSLQITGDATINGSTAIGDDLNVGGLTTTASLRVTGSANIGGDLTVHGDGSFGGNLSVTGNLTVSGATSVQDITINGHVITAGNVPQVQIMGNAGANAVVSVTGNDTSGTITLITGTSGTTQDNNVLNSGDQATLTFAKQYGGMPHIIITANDGKSAPMEVYPDQQSQNGFSIALNKLPDPNTTYTFEYFIVQ